MKTYSKDSFSPCEQQNSKQIPFIIRTCSPKNDFINEQTDLLWMKCWMSKSRDAHLLTKNYCSLCYCLWAWKTIQFQEFPINIISVVIVRKITYVLLLNFKFWMSWKQIKIFRLALRIFFERLGKNCKPYLASLDLIFSDFMGGGRGESH